MSDKLPYEEAIIDGKELIEHLEKGVGDKQHAAIVRRLIKELNQAVAGYEALARIVKRVREAVK